MRRSLLFIPGLSLIALFLAVPASMQAEKYWPDGRSAGKRSTGERSLEKHPSGPRAAVPPAATNHYQAGKTFGVQKKYEEAIAEFDAALKIAPNMIDATVDRASAYMQLKEFDKAIAGYNQALDFNPNILRAYSFRAYCHLMKKQFAQAVKDYSATLRLDPEDAQAYFNRAKAYEKLGQAINAARDRATMQRLHLSLDMRDRFAGGRRFLNQGSFSMALRCFDSAAKDEPENAKVYFYRARTHLALQQYNEAIADCKKVDTLIENEAKARVRGKSRPGEDRIASSLTVDAIRAAASFELRKFDEALRGASSHLKSNPQDVDILLLRARIHEARQANADAINDYSRAIAIDPHRIAAYKCRASLEERMNQRESAEGDLRKALSLSPEDDSILYELFAFHFRGKQYKQAIDDCNLLVGINEKDGDAYRMRAEARVYLRDYARAIEDYSKAIELDSAGAWRLLNARARLYDLTGRKDLASQDRDRASRLNPAGSFKP